ncbi:GP3 envelope protein [African pouched rat arterivirus]|uniref:GP3 envelope protein n=1 Tax=African pouched rat arterivirus TaxID=1965064 RepID=A0A0B5JFR5_9NIDO|nr:GP3 envelope protein [African pouched rat arterivirus]AJG06161.1 GP3 envelope protein [African pouched rat arterivirus]
MGANIPSVHLLIMCCCLHAVSGDDTENSLVSCFSFPESNKGSLQLSATVSTCPAKYLRATTGEEGAKANGVNAKAKGGFYVSVNPKHPWCGYHHAVDNPGTEYQYRDTTLCGAIMLVGYYDHVYNFVCTGHHTANNSFTYELPPHQIVLPMVLQVATYVAILHPQLFGFENITAVVAHENFICFEHGGNPVNITKAHPDSGFRSTLYDLEVQWQYLEWVRPLFSCWLVMCISLTLRRSSALLAER